jgi:hypothetical protein
VVRFNHNKTEKRHETCMKHVSSGTVCFLVSAIFSLINSRFLFLITISYYNYEKKGA